MNDGDTHNSPHFWQLQSPFSHTPRMAEGVEGLMTSNLLCHAELEAQRGKNRPSAQSGCEDSLLMHKAHLYFERLRKSAINFPSLAVFLLRGRLSDSQTQSCAAQESGLSQIRCLGGKIFLKCQRVGNQTKRKYTE